MPWVFSAAVAGGLWFVLGLRPLYHATAGLVVGLLGWQLEAMFAEHRVQKIEVQLADAIDLMVGALRTGAGLTKALESAVYESRPPLREQLDEVAGRIHFGDDPQVAFRSSTERRSARDLFAIFLGPLGSLGGRRQPGPDARYGRSNDSRPDRALKAHAGDERRARPASRLSR